MRNPHLLTDEWSKANNSTDKADASVSVTSVSVTGVNKKFKRKSREPKRLYNSTFDSMDLKDFHQDTISADETQEEPCVVGQHPPVPHKSILLPRITDGKPPVTSVFGQSGALDMRIGNNVPAITARLSQLPVSQLPNLRTSRWSSPVSQHQSNGNKLGPQLAFHTVNATNSSHDHAPIPHHHAYSQELSSPSHLRGTQERGERAVTVPHTIPGAFHTERNGHTAEFQDDSPKESKRTGIGPDPPSGRVPEVKAVQQTRRLLANARERTRVHTISAAFEALRKQVPCYSYGQKLSKLAILRIACNYILSLAQLAELDYTSDHNSLTFSQCVEQCTRTLQAEGRSKKRKE